MLIVSQDKIKEVMSSELESSSEPPSPQELSKKTSNMAPGKGASQTSLSSLSELNDDSMKNTRFEVTSVDALSLEGDVSDKQEHANSEFEIMSVVVDLDSSSARQPASGDESLKSLAKLVGDSDKPGPSRFKRVNMYERGRWTIKDLANTEESQKDAKSSQKSDSDSPSNALTLHKNTLAEYSDSIYTGSSTELGQLSSGSGILMELSSEKDSGGSGIDRSSTAAESGLSRKSSLSSIIPDDHFDTESVASATGSTAGRDRDTPETSSQTAAATTLAPPITTLAVVTKDEPHEPSDTSSETKEPVRQQALTVKEPRQELLTGPASVKHAMSHLQSSLEQLLKRNTDVDQQNCDLTEENKTLQAEVDKLKEENAKLVKELAKLKQALAIFVNTSTESGGGEASKS